MPAPAATARAVPYSTTSRRTALLLVAALAALALSLVRPPAAGATTTTAGSYANAVLNLLNQERAASHLPALGWDSRLIAAAHGHNLRMAAADTLSHQLAGEPPFTTRITNAGYHWSYAGENVAWNADTTISGATALETMMYNEVAPNNGHRLNILSAHYTTVGVDVVIDSTHHRIWLTEDFARPA
jgi:uncharacterized protein YkwD